MKVRVAILLAAFVVCAVLLFSVSRKPTVMTSDAAYQKEVATWNAVFAQKPLETAYSEYLTAGNALSYDASHQLAHIVGQILYEKLGVQGISHCSADFAYGCYHGFAGEALYAAGLNSILQLEAACKESLDVLGCEHGIGHGILSFIGNSSLSEALKHCATLHQSSPVGGCYGGVFMEYNFQTMQSGSGIAVRTYDASHAYEPCASQVPPQFREACYFDEPAWWRAAATDAGSSDEARLRILAALCENIPTQENRATCFNGIGNVIGPTSGYDATVMKKWCSVMPKKEDRDACLTTAQGHLRARSN